MLQQIAEVRVLTLRAWDILQRVVDHDLRDDDPEPLRLAIGDALLHLDRAESALRRVSYLKKT
jgi:hypothetical protein